MVVGGEVLRGPRRFFPAHQLRASVRVFSRAIAGLRDRSMSGNIMNAAVMGMNAQTSWLSTISQNIANSSTTGYKNAETEFNSLVDQASASNYSAGGVSTTAMSMNSLQGGLSGTSTVTNLAVQGDGFFVVSDAAGDTFLTRNGSFVPDASGNLVNSAGYYLMGSNVQNNS